MNYEVQGTGEASPSGDSWDLIVTTDDPVKAVRVLHETEGTFWRRLLEDGRVVIPRA